MPAERLLALVILTGVAIGVALVLQRRRPDPPSAPSYRAPAQLDRADFVADHDGLFVALFSSSTCHTCPVAWEVVERVLADPAFADVASQRIDVQDDPELHQRYRIDGVPTIVVADAEGVVVQAFFGPVTDDDLVEALQAAARPGEQTTLD